MQVDEPGRDRAAGRVEHDGPARRVDAIADGHDPSGAHEHVGAPGAGGVDDGAAANEELTRHGHPPTRA